MSVDQSGFDQHLVFTQMVERELVIFVLGDAVKHVCFILDFDGLENRSTQIVANGMATMTHSVPLTLIEIEQQAQYA